MNANMLAGAVFTAAWGGVEEMQESDAFADPVSAASR